MKPTRTLLIDGNWNLKRNFYKQPNLKSSTGHLCGAVVGFIFSLKSVINKVLPDRVIVMWDGYHAGKLRYEIYKPYKANRGKKWDEETRAIEKEGISMDEKDRENFELLKQKMIIVNILDELFIRQAEVDLIEADDLIAQYVLKSEEEGEEIFIYSRDKDYFQLISEKVKIINPDSLLILDRKTFEDKFGHTVENELLFKCFEGDTSDTIKGVLGITRKKLIKYFPDIAKEKYLYSRLLDECYKAKEEKSKLKVYDLIIGAQEILYRNAKLMNLKKPFLNEEAKKMVDIIKHGTLDETREISNAISMFIKEGIMTYIGQEQIDNFLSPFYMIMSKEKEYSKKMKI